MEYGYLPGGTRNWIFVGGIIAVLIGLISQFPVVQEWLLRWGDLLGVIGSLILSALLVLLYHQQTKLLAAEQQPFVEVEQYEGHHDRLEIFLSNYGKGVATKIELVVATVFPPVEEFEPGIAISSLRREPKDSDTYRRGKGLRVGEDRIRFTCRHVTLGLGLRQVDSPESSTGVIQRPNGPMSRYSFGTGLDTLSRTGVSVIRIHYYIRITDSLGHQSVKYFGGIELDGDVGQISVEEAHEMGGVLDWGQPEVSANDLSFDIAQAEMRDERTVK